MNRRQRAIERAKPTGPPQMPVDTTLVLEEKLPLSAEAVKEAMEQMGFVNLKPAQLKAFAVIGANYEHVGVLRALNGEIIFGRNVGQQWMLKLWEAANEPENKPLLLEHVAAFGALFRGMTESQKLTKEILEMSNFPTPGQAQEAPLRQSFPPPTLIHTQSVTINSPAPPPEKTVAKDEPNP